MKYSLFIANNCHECAFVEKEVRQIDVELEIHNVDNETVHPPVTTFAYPALFKNDILLAYGSDIIEYLKKKA